MPDPVRKDELDALVEMLKRALRPAAAAPAAVVREGYGLEGAEIAPASKSPYERTLATGEYESMTPQERAERATMMASEAALALSLGGRALEGKAAKPRPKPKPQADGVLTWPATDPELRKAEPVAPLSALDARIEAARAKVAPASRPSMTALESRIEASRATAPKPQPALDLDTLVDLAAKAKASPRASAKPTLEPPSEFVAQVRAALAPEMTDESSVLRVAREAWMRDAARRAASGSEE